MARRHNLFYCYVLREREHLVYEHEIETHCGTVYATPFPFSLCLFEPSNPEPAQIKHTINRGT